MEKCECNFKSDATATVKPKAGRVEGARERGDCGTETSSRTSFVCIAAHAAVSRPQQQIFPHLSKFMVK